MDNKKLMAEIIKRLKKEYPVLKSALDFSSPFELLTATILSAQTTDVHVNKVTGPLFKKYRSVKDFANADPAALEKDVSSVNFYRNKARNILNAARIIVEKFGGEVPRSMAELITLPGVARKTANIVLCNAYGIIEGIAVDTHVMRLSTRLGLTKNDDPVKIEKELMEITPKKEWGNINHLLVFHGRKICQARKPMHDACVLRDICPSRNI
ncbi:MAG TPA: endonuclease III [Dissulfurispiraceae bacterium]|nr:endonuclease III [Dissulfurispiraceae bacterium]